MREPDRLEPEPEPELKEKEEEDFVWPLPPSSSDIVWLDPPQPQLSASDSQRSPVGSDKAATPRVPQQPTALPLSRLLSPEVACDWHDAVALVQQLAEQVTHGGREEPAGSLPDIHRIVEPNGELRVRLDPRGRESLVRGLGNLLSRLLTNRDSPAAVRLIVSQVMSDLPTIRTVEELVRELARWERPYRIQKVVALYERARNAPDISPTPDLSEIDRLTDPSTIIFPTAPDSPESPNAFDSFRDPLARLRGLKKYRSAMLNVAAVVVCLLLASSAAIVMLRSPSSASARLPPAAGVETPEAPEPADPATAAAPRCCPRPRGEARCSSDRSCEADVPASSAAVSRSRLLRPQQRRHLRECSLSRGSSVTQHRADKADHLKHLRSPYPRPAHRRPVHVRPRHQAPSSRRRHPRRRLSANRRLQSPPIRAALKPWTRTELLLPTRTAVRNRRFVSPRRHQRRVPASPWLRRRPRRRPIPVFLIGSTRARIPACWHLC
jgi:hypothetical protein